MDRGNYIPSRVGARRNGQWRDGIKKMALFGQRCMYDDVIPWDYGLIEAFAHGPVSNGDVPGCRALVMTSLLIAATPRRVSEQPVGAGPR